MAETRDTGVEANGRLTAMTGIALLVLLAAEGITILRIHRLLPAHFFIGLLLIPPVVLKMTSTGYRFVRYYMGDPDYRRAGPPPPLLDWWRRSWWHRRSSSSAPDWSCGYSGSASGPFG